MNFDTQGLQRTWPHGTASTAFEEFERALRHEGQERMGAFVFGSGSSVKFITVKVFRDRLCGEASLEDGQSGFSFGGFIMVCVAFVAVLESGVWDGTQKEGRCFAEAFWIAVSTCTRKRRK
jgi:hypothetical protein